MGVVSGGWVVSAGTVVSCWGCELSVEFTGNVVGCVCKGGSDIFPQADNKMLNSTSKQSSFFFTAIPPFLISVFSIPRIPPNVKNNMAVAKGGRLVYNMVKYLEENRFGKLF